MRKIRGMIGFPTESVIAKNHEIMAHYFVILSDQRSLISRLTYKRKKQTRKVRKERKRREKKER